jgi:precorrin-3B C17-methyltransferase
MSNILYVIGIGPGGGKDMTFKAYAALKSSDIIAGYTKYVELIKDDFADKEFLSTGMRSEEKRCELAYEEADKGKTVAMVCSGDPGIYGMASLCLEIGAKRSGNVKIEVIPGVTAACGGAALLGAPLSHDFAVISLSDLLTPWETIEKRLRCAAEADFAVCIYNPQSHTRKDYLDRACAILLESKPPETVCGLVHNLGRDGESCELTTLYKLGKAGADMFTTVFIGNNSTLKLGNRMVTPRGYMQRDKAL